MFMAVFLVPDLPLPPQMTNSDGTLRALYAKGKL